MSRISEWLKSENKFLSRPIEGSVSNLSVICAVLGIIMLSSAFFLANTSAFEDSSRYQFFLIVLSLCAFAPIVYDIYKEEK